MNKETVVIWINRIIKIFEILSIVFLIAPYGSMGFYIFASSFWAGDYFIFFPIAMFLFLPAGVVSFLFQTLRNYRKQPMHGFNTFIHGFSVLTIIIGCLAWMAIYVVTGG